jgi:hypothetical protein
MPSTYTLISSNVLTTTAASVTFSAIPSTYTDLAVRMSVRNDGESYTDYFSLTINSDSTTLYSVTFLQGTDTTPSSVRSSSATALRVYNATSGAATANTFSSVELYIPNYTSTTNKPIGSFGVSEANDAANTKMQAVAGLYRNTTAISSLSFTVNFAANFVSGSSFYLYGIKNS